MGRYKTHAVFKKMSAPKVVRINDVAAAWTLVAIAGSILLLYSLSRIISLQRRVRDLEARPPVDDIVMRGMVRKEVSDVFNSFERRPKEVKTEKAEPKEVKAEKAEVKPEPKEVKGEKHEPKEVKAEVNTEVKADEESDHVQVEVAPEEKPKRRTKKLAKPEGAV